MIQEWDIKKTSEGFYLFISGTAADARLVQKKLTGYTSSAQETSVAPYNLKFKLTTDNPDTLAKLRIAVKEAVEQSQKVEPFIPATLENAAEQDASGAKTVHGYTGFINLGDSDAQDLEKTQMLAGAAPVIKNETMPFMESLLPAQEQKNVAPRPASEVAKEEKKEPAPAPVKEAAPVIQPEAVIATPEQKTPSPAPEPADQTPAPPSAAQEAEAKDEVPFKPEEMVKEDIQDEVKQKLKFADIFETETVMNVYQDVKPSSSAPKQVDGMLEEFLEEKTTFNVFEQTAKSIFDEPYEESAPAQAQMSQMPKTIPSAPVVAQPKPKVEETITEETISMVGGPLPRPGAKEETPPPGAEPVQEEAQQTIPARTKTPGATIPKIKAAQPDEDPFAALIGDVDLNTTDRRPKKGSSKFFAGSGASIRKAEDKKEKKEAPPSKKTPPPAPVKPKAAEPVKEPAPAPQPGKMDELPAAAPAAAEPVAVSVAPKTEEPLNIQPAPQQAQAVEPEVKPAASPAKAAEMTSIDGVPSASAVQTSIRTKEEMLHDMNFSQGNAIVQETVLKKAADIEKDIFSEFKPKPPQGMPGEMTTLDIPLSSVSQKEAPKKEDVVKEPAPKVTGFEENVPKDETTANIKVSGEADSDIFEGVAKKLSDSMMLSQKESEDMRARLKAGPQEVEEIAMDKVPTLVGVDLTQMHTLASMHSIGAMPPLPEEEDAPPVKEAVVSMSAAMPSEDSAIVRITAPQEEARPDVAPLVMQRDDETIITPDKIFELGETQMQAQAFPTEKEYDTMRDKVFNVKKKLEENKGTDIPLENNKQDTEKKSPL